MTFNSLPFLLFLSAMYLLVTASGEKGRWPLLLAGSVVFYAAFRVPYLLLALGVVTSLSYLAGHAMAKSDSARCKRAILVAGVSGNLAVLVLLKYLTPLWVGGEAISRVFSVGFQAGTPPLLASIGVSYYVFQAISYLADIYLEKEEPEGHFGYFALYLAFFPKLLQGPIERAGDLLPQLKRPYSFQYDNARRGLVLFSWGLWKKLVIADRLAIVVGMAYGDVQGYAGLALLVATYCYALQIYCDFSGYTDMARGVALLFNIELTENFNAPYAATSVADFWRRWHISFSRWILDYIFRPLQMHWREWGNAGTAAALVVTFLASGIWHGARWGFLAWGLLHGVYMAAAVLWRPFQKKVYGALGVKKGRALTLWQTVVTFHLVVYAWVFFRAATLADAWGVTRSFGRMLMGDLGPGGLEKLINIFGRNDALIAAAATAVLLGVSVLRDRVRFFDSPAYLRWPCYAALMGMILLLSAFHGSSEFIYVQF